MARNREKSGLPPNLYESGGYFQWRHPVSGKRFGLGSDRQRAIREAREANWHITRIDDTERERIRSESQLYDAEGILLRALPRRKKCGIYFLIQGDEIIYIGQSRDCYRRLSEHENSPPRKSFDAYCVIEVSPGKLDEIEAAYIAKFQPRLNITLPRMAGASLPTFIQ